MQVVCEQCHAQREPKDVGFNGICDFCFEENKKLPVKPELMGCRLFEYGHENPMDPKGSTAHVRDIKARRVDPKTGRLFYYQPPKKYFFLGGKQ